MRPSTTAIAPCALATFGACQPSHAKRAGSAEACAVYHSARERIAATIASSGAAADGRAVTIPAMRDIRR